jgi:hypothetical protein
MKIRGTSVATSVVDNSAQVFILVSISPLFHEQLFHMKVFCAAFMCLQFGFVIFWQKDFGTKTVHKMLVKLAPVTRALSAVQSLKMNIFNENISGSYLGLDNLHQVPVENLFLSLTVGVK